MAAPTHPLLNAITVEGFLSFGRGTEDFRLEPLNIVIGPNGSGKSNLIEAMSILRAVPRDLPLPIRQGGRVQDWLWRPETSRSEASHRGASFARIEVVFTEGSIARHHSQPAVRYRLDFGAEGDSFVVLDERLENADKPSDKYKPYFYFGYENGRPMLNVQDGTRRELRREDLVEGGGDSKHLRNQCRRGFRKFIERAGLEGRMLVSLPVADGTVPTRVSRRRSSRTWQRRCFSATRRAR